MKLGSLFSGYGGLDLAVNAVFGSRTAWHSDIEPGPTKILAHHYPDVPNLGDITQIDWATVEPVDIIAGGSPCQDLSLARALGRPGMHAGTRSGLWESMREGIAIIKPTFVAWENVKGALSAGATSNSTLESDQGQVGDGAKQPVLRALGRVLGDLTNLGYDAQWITVPASDIGAPHRRERVFVLAHRRDAVIAYASSGRSGRWSPLASPGAEREQDAPTIRPNLRPDSSGLREVASPFGAYAPAITRWEHVIGRPAPAPTQPGRNRPQLSAHFAEWLMGLPAGHVTDVPNLTRNEQLRALGNGVVPQQGTAAIRHLLDLMEGRAVA